MIFNSSEFVFNAPRPITRARRVLIKPETGDGRGYPYSTSAGMLNTVIDGIRRVSDADILILGGTPDGSPVIPLYKSLGYDFPRVIMLDVKDCVWVEVDNPLEKPLAIPTFMLPNVVLSSDYLISACPLKTKQSKGRLSIANLLSLLPVERYGQNWQSFTEFDLDRVLADLYFTMPFDMGIVDGTSRLDIKPSTRDSVRSAGTIFQGEPYYIDRTISTALEIDTPYLDFVDETEAELEEEEEED